MTPETAREYLHALELKQVDVARELSQLTGRNYTPQNVNDWLREGGRGPSVAFIVYLKLKLQLAGLADD